MIVLDTHAWIWLAAAPERLGDAASALVGAERRIGVPAICCWEIATKVEKGTLAFDRDVEVWLHQALGADRVEALPLTAAVATRAGLLGRRGFHGDPADRLIAATAIELRSPLVTVDAAITAFAKRERSLTVVW